MLVKRIAMVAALMLLNFYAALALAAGEHSASNLQSPTVIDRVVAVVGQQPILLSQLELEARITLINNDATEAADAVIDHDALASVLEYSIGERLAVLEADRLKVFTVEETEVARAMEAFKRKFASEQAYRNFLVRQETNDEQVAAVLRRSLRVKYFLDTKTKLSWKTNDNRPTRDQLVQKVFDELRARADVRVMAPFANQHQATTKPTSGNDRAAPKP